MNDNRIEKVLCIFDYYDCVEGFFYDVIMIAKKENSEDNLYVIKDKNDKEVIVYGKTDFNYYFQECENEPLELNLENLRKIPLFMRQVELRCEQILRWKDKHDKENLIWPTSYISYGIEDLRIKDDYVLVKIHETWSYGGSDYHYYKIPHTKIVSDDWHDSFLRNIESKRIQIEQEKTDKIAKKEADERQSLLDAEKRDQEEYKRLKNKYENS